MQQITGERHDWEGVGSVKIFGISKFGKVECLPENFEKSCYEVCCGNRQKMQQVPKFCPYSPWRGVRGLLRICVKNATKF